jgi:hypothetical protein
MQLGIIVSWLVWACDRVRFWVVAHARHHNRRVDRSCRKKKTRSKGETLPWSCRKRRCLTELMCCFFARRKQDLSVHGLGLKSEMEKKVTPQCVRVFSCHSPLFQKSGIAHKKNTHIHTHKTALLIDHPKITTATLHVRLQSSWLCFTWACSDALP